MIDELDKKWIDSASYEQLLRLWRQAPAGTKIFAGESGEYYQKVMAEKKAQDPGAAVRASKRIGW